MRGLGGKLGESVVSELGVETMGQLAALSLRQISAKFEEKTAHWLHLLGRGRPLLVWIQIQNFGPIWIQFEGYVSNFENNNKKQFHRKTILLKNSLFSNVLFFNHKKLMPPEELFSQLSL